MLRGYVEYPMSIFINNYNCSNSENYCLFLGKYIALRRIRSNTGKKIVIIIYFSKVTLLYMHGVPGGNAHALSILEKSYTCKNYGNELMGLSREN